MSPHPEIPSARPSLSPIALTRQQTILDEFLQSGNTGGIYHASTKYFYLPQKHR